MIAIDTGALSNGVPVFYSAVVGGKKADFFVLLLDGEVRAYFDACKECYFKKLGYRFDKGHVVCKACNIRFPLDRLDSGIGGCYPIKLKGTMKGNVFTISREDIAAGLKYF